MASNLHSTYIERCNGENSVDPGELLWQIFDDVQGSYILALKGIGLTPQQISEVTDTTSDYLANHYGDN